MSHLEALAFIYIASEANTRTGIWKGCAKSLSGELAIPERTARDLLEKMQHGDYIRRFATPGRHFCYPILVHKFPITQGEHNGEQLNAIESPSPADLRYFSREHSVEQDGEQGVEHGAAQRRSENREGTREKKKSPAASPPADLRYQDFVDFAYQSFETKHNRKPLWDGKDWKGLQNLFKSHCAEALSLERLKALWGNYSASSEPFTVKQGDSLAYFCANVDKFSDGPILAASRGKANANSHVENLRGVGRALAKSAGLRTDEVN